MSSDDFEIDFERFAWVGIERHYSAPSFEHKKRKHIRDRTNCEQTI
jgi:hypothetical protein